MTPSNILAPHPYERGGRTAEFPAPMNEGHTSAEFPASIRGGARGGVLNKGQLLVLDCIKAHPGLRVPAIEAETNLQCPATAHVGTLTKARGKKEGRKKEGRSTEEVSEK